MRFTLKGREIIFLKKHFIAKIITFPRKSGFSAVFSTLYSPTAQFTQVLRLQMLNLTYAVRIAVGYGKILSRIYQYKIIP